MAELELAGTTAIVSGAANGVGAASAQALAREGARVVVTDYDFDAAQQFACELAESGAEVLALDLDVRSETAWQEAVATVEDVFGSIDVLVNNAGTGASRDENNQTIRLHALPTTEWDRVFDINVRGVFLGIRAVIPSMRRAGGGSIINISSIGGIVGSRVSAYGSSKGAVRSMTKATAVRLAGDRIRVNSIHPGVVRTGMTRVMLGSEESRTAAYARYPMGRVADPMEIAEGVAFLASERASFITGSEVVIDGGLTAW